MRSPIRRRSMVLAIGVFSLATAGVMAPGAFAANTVDSDVKVSNTETVQVAMDASGHIDAKRVYEQLVLTGNGKVDVANPISTKGLRNLDGFGRYDIRDGAVRVKTDVNGTKKYRSVSDFTKKLPLDVKVTYTLDGRKLDPKDIVGKSGTLEVRYVITNVTGTTEDVPFTNGEGKTETSPQEVVVPMVGTLDTTLPSSFTKIVPDGANAAGDGRGGTMLSFTMTLIPPIGKATAEIGYTAKVKNATIPKADISALPVNPLENVSFKGGAEAYKGGAESGQDLTAGATEINANVIKLRDGANDLVAGILKLQAGADQLSDGGGKLSAGAAKLQAEGTHEVASGASRLQKEGTGELASGAGQLDAGAGKLNVGAGDLSDGLKKAGASAPALLGGLKTVADGLAQVDAGLTQLNGQVVPGANQISGGAAALISAIDNQLAPGLDQVTGALDQALAVAANVADPTQKAQLTALLGGAKSGVATVKGGLTGSVKSGLTGIKGGGDAIASGVNGATGAGGSLKNGVAALRAGVDKLQDGGVALADGLGQLSSGADKLKAGTSDLKAGTGDLKSGANTLDEKASELSEGAKTVDGKMGELASGSSQLSNGLVQLKAGLDTAADGAPALPEGADRLSKEGTSKVVESGKETAMDFGQRYALLEAGAKRAVSAQPYGSPEGATALTAYKFEIAGENGADSANLKRGLAALALMAGAGIFATARRRGMI